MIESKCKEELNIKVTICADDERQLSMLKSDILYYISTLKYKKGLEISLINSDGKFSSIL